MHFVSCTVHRVKTICMSQLELFFRSYLYCILLFVYFVRVYHCLFIPLNVYLGMELISFMMECDYIIYFGLESEAALSCREQ